MSSSFYKYNIASYLFTIVEENNFITYVTLDNLRLNIPYKKTKLVSKTIQELEEYFKGIRKEFDIPLKLTGTDFQNRVWECMRNIPYGTTISYQDLAKKIGNPKACRAIGNVCHNNKILILIPCHRVVAKNSLGGFGCGIAIKIKLLELEGVM